MADMHSARIRFYSLFVHLNPLALKIPSLCMQVKPPIVSVRVSSTSVLRQKAVYNQWTGLLEWTTEMDYCTDLYCTKNHFYAF